MDEVTNPEPEVAPIESETEDFTEFEAAHDDEPEGFDTSEDNPEAETADDDGDWELIDHKGKQVKVPKGAAMMQADYTRKTQELAEQRKALEATLQQVNEVSQAERQIETEYIGIQQALAAYEDIDWWTWVQQDPIAAQQARSDMEGLHRQANLKQQQHQQAMNHRLAITQQETAKRIAEGHQVLAKSIPGWGGDKAKALVDYGQKAYNFTAQELQAINDPRIILALHDAYQFREQQAKQQQRAKVEAKVQAKPVPTLKGNSGRVGPKPDTNDFKAFEKMAAKVLSAR